MIMKRTIIVLLMAVIMVLSLFSGCTKNDENTLLVATNAEFAPWEFLKDGEIVGFDADLIKLVAEKMGMKIKFENMNLTAYWFQLLQVVAMQLSQALLSTITKKSVDFSTPYYIGASRF